MKLNTVRTAVPVNQPSIPCAYVITQGKKYRALIDSGCTPFSFISQAAARELNLAVQQPLSGPIYLATGKDKRIGKTSSIDITLHFEGVPDPPADISLSLPFEILAGENADTQTTPFIIGTDVINKTISSDDATTAKWYRAIALTATAITKTPSITLE